MVIVQLLLVRSPTGDQTCSPGKSPNQESNRDLSLCGARPIQLSQTAQGKPARFLLGGDRRSRFCPFPSWFTNRDLTEHLPNTR